MTTTREDSLELSSQKSATVVSNRLSAARYQRVGKMRGPFAELKQTGWQRRLRGILGRKDEGSVRGIETFEASTLTGPIRLVGKMRGPFAELKHSSC
jgi:hypothetical protein